MHENGRRRRIEPTDEWERVEFLCAWPEQRDYELIRPLVLFGASAAQRAAETSAASERTLQRRAKRFEAEGMESLFGSEHARRKRLPPAVRRLVVDLKAEYQGFNPNEIANACYVRFGSRPARKTVKRVLAEEPLPLRMVRRFPPYHETPGPAERRRAVVALHAEGWSAKAIAGYLRAHRSTVHRVLRRWAEEGADGLEDRPHGRPPGVRRVDLKAIEAVRRLQRNPNLGAFRVHAALAQVGIHLSPRTCGRILATNRALYGLDKPKGPSKEKKEMPGFLNLQPVFDFLLQQFKAVVPQSAFGMVQNITKQVQSQASGGTMSFGVGVALWSASSAVRMAMHALNVAYDVEDRAGWKKIPLSVVNTLILATLLIVAAGLMFLEPKLIQPILQPLGLGQIFLTIWTWARIPVAVLLLMLAVALIYWLFPNVKQPFRFITPGAVIAVIVWIVASLGFSFYVANFSSYSATYGALASVIVLLLYFFISAAILLLGAEINAESYRGRAEGGEDEQQESG